MHNFQGNDFYDNPEVFERYVQHRKKYNNPNEIIEKPIIRSLLHDINGRVLDLGCGYGDLAPFILEKGGEHYTGLDASAKMIALGKTHIQDKRIELIQADIERWPYETKAYHWVISRLVFHYIKDLETL